jgi:kynurenine formamidase
MKLVDLSQPWGYDTPPFPGQPGPTITWVRRLPTDRVNIQHIDTTLHVGTHLDAPLHFVSAGRDIEAIKLDQLYGSAVVADISSFVSDYSIYTPDLVQSVVDVKPGDTLFIHTGYHRYFTYGTKPDEERYFCKHPGPDCSFVEWCLEMKFRLLGIDTSSMDHPMNTVIRRLRPDLALKAESNLGKKLEDMFPASDFQCMHMRLFPHDLVHVENLGGDIAMVLNQRVTIGVFPWRFRGGEAAMCRVVAFLDE